MYIIGDYSVEMRLRITNYWLFKKVILLYTLLT